MQQDIVIFAPHQDDEILGGYAVIRQQPEHIYVVFLTNGDYEGADVARTRWQESCAALTHLGVPRDHILTLGYADTGMPRPVSFLWRLWHGEPASCWRRPSAHIPTIPQTGNRNITSKNGVHTPPIRGRQCWRMCAQCWKRSGRAPSI